MSTRAGLFATATLLAATVNAPISGQPAEQRVIVVFHDEVDLPPAKVRVKIGGGVAGHNGLRSITAHVGNDYKRVRIGIGKPEVKELVPNHVLGDFAKDDWPWVEALCDVMADNAGLLVEGRDSSFQNRVHLAMEAKGFDDGADESPDE